MDFLDDVRREKLNFLVGVGAIQHDFGGAKFVAAMQQRDLARKFGEEGGFLHGGIAAADHHDFLAAKKEAVAGGAGGNAVAQKMPLRFDAQHARRRPRRNDQRLCLVGFLSGDDLEWPFAQVHRRNRA